MSVKILFGNYKGGVGKTTSVFNLAYCFAKKGKRVLLIDLDPQCSLTEICIKNDPAACVSKSESTAELPTLNGMLCKLYARSALGVGSMLGLEELRETGFDKAARSIEIQGQSVDYVPTELPSHDGIGLDGLIDIFQANADRSILLLPEALSLLERETSWDYIFIDTPPSNNVLTRSAFLLSDYYIIPYIADVLSTNGVDHYIETMKSTYRAYCKNHAFADIYQEVFGRESKALGIFWCMQKGEEHPSASVHQEIKSFKAHIRDYVAISRYTGSGGISVEKVEAPTDSYMALADEMLGDLEPSGRCDL